MHVSNVSRYRPLTIENLKSIANKKGKYRDQARNALTEAEKFRRANKTCIIRMDNELNIIEVF